MSFQISFLNHSYFPSQRNVENVGIKLFSFLPYKLTNELNEVEENVLSLRTTMSHGPDRISAQFLFIITAQLKYPLLFLFNLSLTEGEINPICMEN